jgi:hypothetical protein
LGPILFLIYINDLPNATDLATFMFANDTATLKSMKNFNELITSVNNELKKWQLGSAATEWQLIHQR